MTTNESTRERTAEAWEALREGRCGDARDAFEKALAGEETPESREGISWFFEDALDLLERTGTLFEAARARIELATSLFALGRTPAAEGEAATARNVSSGSGPRRRPSGHGACATPPPTAAACRPPP